MEYSVLEPVLGFQVKVDDMALKFHDTICSFPSYFSRALTFRVDFL